MKISQASFDLLTTIERCKDQKISQHRLSRDLEVSLGKVNGLVKELSAAGLISLSPSIRLTEEGQRALEPYRVRRAIILAAGFSERLAPITLETPKPLVKVKGVRILDTIIAALKQAEVERITVVTGYKAEQFEYLSADPAVELIHNPLYNETGNIMTLYAARDRIDRCYICDADLFVHNPAIFSKYEYTSQFFGVPVRASDDWCFTVEKNRIRTFGIGGEACFQSLFIAYISAEDSEKVRKDLEKTVSARGGKERHWSDVLFHKGADYRIQPKRCFMDDVSEVDTIGDLIKLDESYFGTHL